MAAPLHFDREQVAAEITRTRAALEAAYADAPPMDRAIILASLKIMEAGTEFIVACKEMGAPHELVAAYAGNAMGEVAGAIGENWHCGCVMPRIVNGFLEQIKQRGKAEHLIAGASFEVAGQQGGRA